MAAATAARSRRRSPRRPAPRSNPRRARVHCWAHAGVMGRLLLIPLALLVLLAGAMVWSGGTGSAAERQANFRFINRGEIKTLDPNRMSWLQDIRVGLALWEGLYSLDPVTLEPIPGTADPVEVSQDKLVYSFHIR